MLVTKIVGNKETTLPNRGDILICSIPEENIEDYIMLVYNKLVCYVQGVDIKTGVVDYSASHIDDLFIKIQKDYKSVKVVSGDKSSINLDLRGE